MSSRPVGSRVRRSMSAAVFEYFATSSIAMVSPVMPAPEPPSSSGMHKPRSPASLKSSNKSEGYSPDLSISRAARLHLLGVPAGGPWTGARTTPVTGRNP